MSEHDAEHDFDDAARALETRDLIAGTFEIGDEEYPLETREPTLEEIEDMEADLEDGDELEAIRAFVERYLEAPAVDPGGMGLTKLRALFVGMRDAWNDVDVIEEAEAEMPIDDSGNRRTSRR